MVLPLFKLGTLAFRTLCKPIATRIKHRATVHPKFRGFIIDLAQTNHRFSTNMQRRLSGRATDVHIRPLNEEKAIQVAADSLGELFLYSVAAATIIYEWRRSVRSEAKKEQIRKQEMEAIKNIIDEQNRELEVYRHRMNAVEQLLGWSPSFGGLTPAQAATAKQPGTQQPTAA